MRKLAVVSRKGGTGKTTLAVNLAMAAHCTGRSVVLADIDGQRSSLEWARARSIPGPEAVQTSAGGLFQLMLMKEKKGADLMILDTPGSFEDGVLQSINLSDMCLLVTRPNFLDIASLLTTAEAVRRLGKPALVVLNQAPPRRNGLEAPVVNRAVEALRFTGLPIASVGLRARAAYQASMQRGLAVFEWEPSGPAAEEARRLWADVEARLLNPAAKPASLRA
jgi:chromosome partitioning protein